jgi:hypothetical protein
MNMMFLNINTDQFMPSETDAVILYFADTASIAVWLQNEMKSWL